jgi:uncharacterized protein (DUF1919 family)
MMVYLETKLVVSSISSQHSEDVYMVSHLQGLTLSTVMPTNTIGDAVEEKENTWRSRTQKCR